MHLMQTAFINFNSQIRLNPGGHLFAVSSPQRPLDSQDMVECYSCFEKRRLLAYDHCGLTLFLLWRFQIENEYLSVVESVRNKGANFAHVQNVG